MLVPVELLCEGDFVDHPDGVARIIVIRYDDWQQMPGRGPGVELSNGGSISYQAGLQTEVLNE